MEYLCGCIYSAEGKSCIACSEHIHSKSLKAVTSALGWSLHARDPSDMPITITTTSAGSTPTTGWVVYSNGRQAGSSFERSVRDETDQIVAAWGWPPAQQQPTPRPQPQVKKPDEDAWMDAPLGSFEYCRCGCGGIGCCVREQE